MKYLVLSDLHLTPKFIIKKFDYLYNLISKYDVIIINGDFWSYYSCTFEEFIESSWNQLFPLLKSKKTIYLYGNHDQEIWCNNKGTDLFSNTQSLSTQIETENNKYHIEHGHQIFMKKTITTPWYMSLERKLHIDDVFRYPLELFFSNYFSQPFIDFKMKIGNSYAKNYWRNKNNGKYLIVGHSHLPEEDEEAKVLNSGFINFGYASYIEITDKKHQLIQGRY